MAINGSPLSAQFPEDLGLGDRFFYWRGASGRKYIHSIYAVDACPPLPGAVYVAVRHGALDREVVSVGRFPNCWNGRRDPELVHDAVIAMADEIHVHLLARDDQAANAVFDDLSQAHTESLTVGIGGISGLRTGSGTVPVRV